MGLLDVESETIDHSRLDVHPGIKMGVLGLQVSFTPLRRSPRSSPTTRLIYIKLRCLSTSTRGGDDQTLSSADFSRTGTMDQEESCFDVFEIQLCRLWAGVVALKVMVVRKPTGWVGNL
jgi:hypothetical protein